MCYGLETAAVIGGVMAAAGAAAQGLATQQQLNKQNDIAAAGIIQQGQLQKQAQNDVGQSIKTVAASNASTQAKTAQQLASYQKALQQNTNVSAASPNVPGASSAYKSEQGVAGKSASDYVGAIANSAATTQGTQLERVGEGEQMASTAGSLGLLSQQSSEQSYLTKLQVQATQANPWMKAMGMVLSGAGSIVGGPIAGAAGAATTLATQAGQQNQSAANNISASPMSYVSAVGANSNNAASSNPFGGPGV